MTISFEVKNRWSAETQFHAEIDCAEDEAVSLKLGLAVRWAVKNGANLDGANLVGANLVGANLDGANLDGANLVGANLVGANLDSASLVGANLDSASLDSASLVGANLVGANLDSASLVGADLDGANLVGANLDGANLDSARLDGAILVGANLVGANLRSIRVDLFDVLLRARPEAPGLLAALREGRINGSAYAGECACLCGTIANLRQVNVNALDFVDSSRPAERWFLAIQDGDTPATSAIAKITEGWIEEFLTFAAPVPSQADQGVSS